MLAYDVLSSLTLLVLPHKYLKEIKKKKVSYIWKYVANTRHGTASSHMEFQTSLIIQLSNHDKSIFFFSSFATIVKRFCIKIEKSLKVIPMPPSAAKEQL